MARDKTTTEKPAKKSTIYLPFYVVFLVFETDSVPTAKSTGGAKAKGKISPYNKFMKDVRRSSFPLYVDFQ